jgi:DNA-binding NtrC family response regulator
MEALQGQKLFQALQRSHVVGSPKMAEIYRTIGTVAMGTAPSLSRVKAARGKSWSRAIHEASHRKEKDFCVDKLQRLSRNPIGSELFGYLKAHLRSGKTARRAFGGGRQSPSFWMKSAI